MGVRFPSVASTAIVNQLPASAAETIVCTTPALTLPLDSAQLILLWYANVTPGTSATAVQFRIRRGTALTGALVLAGFGSSAIAAAVQGTISGSYADTPGAVTGQQYTLTLAQIGATGVGAVNDVSLMAFAL